MNNQWEHMKSHLPFAILHLPSYLAIMYSILKDNSCFVTSDLSPHVFLTPACDQRVKSESGIDPHYTFEMFSARLNI